MTEQVAVTHRLATWFLFAVLLACGALLSLSVFLPDATVAAPATTSHTAPHTTVPQPRLSEPLPNGQRAPRPATTLTPTDPITAEHPLSDEEVADALQQILKTLDDSSAMLTAQYEALERAGNDDEYLQALEKLQEYATLEVKCRSSIPKLHRGEYSRVWLDDLGLSLDGKHRFETESETFFGVSTAAGDIVMFQFVRGVDAEVFAVIDSRKESQQLIWELECAKFNALPMEERRRKIEAVVSKPTDNEFERSEKNRRRNELFPYYMVLHMTDYTAHPLRSIGRDQ